MRINFSYAIIYSITFIATLVLALVAFLTMGDYLALNEILWMIVLTIFAIFLAFLAIVYDPSFNIRSTNHNSYRIYIISLLAMILTVWMFLGFSVYGFINSEVAIMTYLFFCLPIWLTLSLSWFELEKTHK